MEMKWKNMLRQGCCKTNGLNHMLVFIYDLKSIFNLKSKPHSM